MAVAAGGDVALLFPFFARPSYQAFHFVLYGCLLYAIIVVSGDGDTQGALLDMMCLLGIANATLLVFQYFGIDPLYTVKSDVVGFMGNPNEASAMLAFCFMAFTRKRWVWFIPLIICGFVACGSAGGPVGVSAGIFIYGILAGHYVLSILSVFGCYLFYGLVHGPYSFEGRSSVWEIGMEQFKDEWLFGHGIGRWKIIFKDIKETGSWFDNAHNEYVQGMVEMGIGFLAVLSGYLIDIARRFRNNERLHRPIAALVIILVNSLVNFPFHIAFTAAIAICWLAILEIELRGFA
ncbi:MAG: O-antigen ligase family protein [Desulfobacterales bacterium]